MSVPQSGKHRLRVCSCGCNRPVTRWTERRHKKPTLIVQPESPPPPNRRRIAHFQAGQESFIIRPGKQEQSYTENNSSTSHSRADASSSSRDHPQLQYMHPRSSSTPPCHCPIHHQHRIYFIRQELHVLKQLTPTPEDRDAEIAILRGKQFNVFMR